jgi:hypothetical protein
MTVMFDSFFGMHPHVIRSGQWRKMKPGEKDLYVYLLEQSERFCTREIKATDGQVTAAVGAASRTLCNARKKLQEYGLIRYKAGQGNRYTYSICNPRTGLPYPGNPRDRVDGTKRDPTKETDQPPRSLVSLARKEPQADIHRASQDQPRTLESYGLPGVFR